MDNNIKRSKETIAIPLGIKSLNKLLRAHWSYKGKMKKDYQLLVVNQMRLNRLRKTDVGEKWIVNITSIRKRKLDYDNLVGGCKPLVDALCEESFIWDDDNKHLVISYNQITNSGPEHTIITREKATDESKTKK